MTKRSENRILARHESADFIGRSAQLERLLRHAEGTDASHGLVLLSAPSAGTSELLRQVYDRLFVGQDDVIPFYFEIRAGDRTAQNTALRFLCEFLLQTVAFRRRDAAIIDASPEMAEIAQLAVPSEGYWIDRMVESYQGEANMSDERSFIRNCLSAPMRAASNGAPSLVIIDDFHAAAGLDGGDAFLEDIQDIFARASTPFVLAGQRRFLFARTPFQTMSLDPFSFSDAGKFAEMLSGRMNVPINEQTRDLIAVQLGGNAGHIGSMFASAAAESTALNSFEHVEQVYTNEVFGGRMGRYFDSIFDRLLPDALDQTPVLRVLSENTAVPDKRIPLAYWKHHSGLEPVVLDAVLDALNYNEIVSVGSGFVEIDEANIVLDDYIRGRTRLEIDVKPRALVVGEALTENVKRAPQLMARHYRQGSAIGLRRLMKAFDGRHISPALIDYSRFKAELKGAGDDKIMKALSDDNEKFALPHIVYTAHTAAFYPHLSEVCDAERSAVALGFSETPDNDEIVWIAAEIDSKLEAKRDVAEFWCDRLEMVALNCNFGNYRIWLVAPEGFNADAMDALRERNAFGSSRKQTDLMAEVLNASVAPKESPSASEYEVVVPMGEDTEMIAAHIIEEIAKRHGFPAKAINQIKTALVEACINAAEHSLSPDRRIFQKFSVSADKITISVSNRGVRLADRKLEATPADEGRRGWGLKLIEGLMDDVRIESTDDGTRITMVKRIKTAISEARA